MRLSRLALALLLAQPALASASPLAPDWQPIPLPGNDMLTMAWDRASVVRDGAIVRVTERVAGPMSGGRRPAEMRIELHCTDRKWRVIRITNYTEAGAPVIQESPEARFTPVRPGGDIDTIRAGAC